MFPPPNSCDCHVHVIGPKARFPLPANRRYTPSDATAAELAAMLKRLGMTRVVIVQPSFYGTDNACTLDGIAQLGNARGVAVLPAQVPAAELDALHKQGIRGLRLNIATAGGAPVEEIKAKADRRGEAVRAARLARAAVRRRRRHRAAGADAARAAGRQRHRSFRPDRAGHARTAPCARCRACWRAARPG